MLRHLADNLAGAWSVMRGRADGLSRLDLSLEGFWQSFAAVILLVPYAVLALLSQHELMGEGGAASNNWLVPGLLALIVDWFAFPVAFAVMARPLGLGTRYVPFIVTRNWAAVIVASMISVIHALYLVGVLPAALATLLLLAGMGLTLWFSYMIVRTALQVGLSMALPIVLFDLMLSIVIWSGFERIAYA